MTTDNALRRALDALKPFADAYPKDSKYLSPVRLIYSDGAKGSLAVEDFGVAHDTYEALTAPAPHPQGTDQESAILPDDCSESITLRTAAEIENERLEKKRSAFAPTGKPPEGVTQADLDTATPLPPLGDSRRIPQGADDWRAGKLYAGQLTLSIGALARVLEWWDGLPSNLRQDIEGSGAPNLEQ